jgi:hypothetical protein
MTITINPVITTNAAGTFSTTLDGMIQGMAMDDPAIRFALTGGQLAPTETLPMFGGIPIAEHLPPTGSLTEQALQNSISRATVAIPPSGISVFNQNHAMINSPQSPVPQADPGMLVNFYRFGSRARIALAMDPALPLLVAAPGLPIGPFPATFMFNIANGWISTTAAGIVFPASVNIIGYNLGNSMTVIYTPATGFCTWNREGSTILLEI